MKRSIGTDYTPLTGRSNTSQSKGFGSQADEKTAPKTPAKPRSNTVATFLQKELTPLPVGSNQVRPSSAEFPRQARAHERRNAFMGGQSGIRTSEDRSGQPSMHRVLDGATFDTSSHSRSSRASCTAQQSECSAGAEAHIADRCRRYDTHGRDAGAPVLSTCSRASPQPREASNASSAQKPANSGSSQMLRSARLRVSTPMRSSGQISGETLTDANESIRLTRSGETASISAKQRFLPSDKSRSHRDSSNRRQEQPNAEASTRGSLTYRNGSEKPGGSTIPSVRGRLAPSSYLFSATRTRDSLLVPGEGRAYHLGVQHGELYNRILTVGHAGRADWLAERFLDAQMRTLSLKSNRNFRLHSGFYKKKPVSIVSIGMGAPMMDVLVREASYITDGPLAIVRLGTCTLLDQDLRPGSIVVATPGSLGCYTNYAYFDGTATDYSRTQEMKPYVVTRPCAADPELSRLIYRHIASHDPDSVFEGLNVSAETFYSCQAREDQLFRDENESLLETLVRCGAQTMEMETHQLLHLASRRVELMKAAAVHIGVTSRTNDHFMHPITPSQLNDLVAVTGKACLDALVDVTI
ncbi:uridine phosphorylase, putative [Eimeria necatrix]|uniref:Uridine phosphorylase, putative n=1 Tax=Eimeria necatrix TaxID=51315 RepID=U6MT19_9EIME|nr:uridine phosphorylase, putative [Eimeria necatrix]CDJ67161.1 uridine phosphorylase, putative [Eimeria necatrix]